MDPTILYVTAASLDEARHISRALVEERIAACANVLGPITSLYRWDGQIQEDTEVAFIVKTRQGLVERVVERIQSLHSYDCPCVASLPITDGNPEFLSWIVKETT